MRVAVVSCWKYRDAWGPFIRLFRKQWPDCSYPFYLVVDEYKPGSLEALGEIVWISRHLEWARSIAEYCEDLNDPILLLQEDFFLNAPVDEELVQHGLELLEGINNIGAVRLYPCPGATDVSDDPYFAPVARGTMYRTSCQATIWKPAYLAQIAIRFNTPAEFELQGSPWASENLPQEVWAFKREVQPWPISYFCSAISRGKWEPAALEFCRQQGITVDTSLRPVA